MQIDSLREEDVQQMTESGWKIDSDQSAEWAIQKIKAAQAECDRWERYYQSMAEKVRNSTQHTIDYMSAKLREYFDTVPHKSTKTQDKYSLPSGDLVMKTPKVEYIYDPDELVKWLKDNGLQDEFVKAVEKPIWGEYKKRLDVDDAGAVYDTQTGRICTAVDHRMTDNKFEVKLTD